MAAPHRDPRHPQAQPEADKEGGDGVKTLIAAIILAAGIIYIAWQASGKLAEACP